MDLYFTLKIPSFVFFLFQIEAIFRSISTAKIRQIWYYGMKCHVLWNNADFFFFNILPNKNNGALGNLWHIPHLLHYKSTKKNTKKGVRRSEFFLLLAHDTAVSVSEVFINYRKRYLFLAFSEPYDLHVWNLSPQSVSERILILEAWRSAPRSRDWVPVFVVPTGIWVGVQGLRT